MKAGDLAVRNDTNTGYHPINGTSRELEALRELARALHNVEDDLTGGIIGERADRVYAALDAVRAAQTGAR